jgi:two-component system cell cycle sensor histidine kinase/response regulator CckA
MARTILLVDDDTEIRTTLRDFLTAQRCIVHTARDGQKALQMLQKIDPPGLIILDYMMPGMNGAQFLAARARDARLRAIPVVILSAWTREWAKEPLDIVEVLAKPVNLERLLEVVDRVCGRSSAEIVAPLQAKGPPGQDGGPE